MLWVRISGRTRLLQYHYFDCPLSSYLKRLDVIYPSGRFSFSSNCLKMLILRVNLCFFFQR